MMAAFKRKSRWTIAVSCVYLLCSTAMSWVAVSGDRVRHHHVKVDEGMGASEGVDDLLTCPNCVFDDQEKAETDRLREVVWQTLYRAEDSDFLEGGSGTVRDGGAGGGVGSGSTTSRTSNMDTMDADDFYGRTSEIIAFAEVVDKQFIV
ncbi:unnamed protein product [Acanthoscelides obtectus]|uniref:Uncharacterized protein n=1 Tax=Acanthoscelides obtectus TaxID=200917 RepID=A0A9P0NQ42_ACAOB|nr:unnamed protein product [Acanthoscelides obtectus]CAK1639928.1 hypothetical protein AOBTE_LOCUS11457 [Acanthoscelides obtectus]